MRSPTRAMSVTFHPGARMAKSKAFFSGKGSWAIIPFGKGIYQSVSGGASFISRDTGIG